MITIEQAQNGLIVKAGGKTTVHTSIEGALVEIISHIEIDGRKVNNPNLVLDQIIKKRLERESVQ